MTGGSVGTFAHEEAGDLARRGAVELYGCEFRSPFGCIDRGGVEDQGERHDDAEGEHDTDERTKEPAASLMSSSALAEPLSVDTSIPETATLPPEGALMAPMRFNSVVLPDPLGPSNDELAAVDLDRDVAEGLHFGRAHQVGLCDVFQLDAAGF